MYNPFLVAALLGFKHALDPDHIAATFNMTLSGKLKRFEATKLGINWGIGHAISMIVLGLPIILFSAAFPEWIYSTSELLVGLVITYLGAALFVQWFRGQFHPHEFIKNTKKHIDHSKSHKRASMMGALHGFGGSYPAALLILSSFTTPLSAMLGLLVFSSLSIISMCTVTTLFSYAAMHHKVIHLLDRLLIPLVIISTLIFGLTYVLTAYQSIF